MRIILTIAFTVLADTALAQTTPRNPYVHLSQKELIVQWEKLMIVSSGDNDQDGIQHLRSHGMGEEGAKALVQFHAKAQAEIDSASRWLFQTLCARQKEIRDGGGAEMIVEIMDQSTDRINGARRRHLAQADSLLSAVDQERLHRLYASDHGPKVHVLNDDPQVANAVRAGKITVEQAIARACELAKEQERGTK